MPTFRVTNLDNPEEVTDFPNVIAGFRPASLLPVPYISQLEDGAKQHNSDCGAAAGLMLLRAYQPGSQMTVDQFYDRCNPDGDKFLGVSQIRGTLEALGVPTTRQPDMNLQSLMAALRAGKPPMPLIKYDVLRKAGLTEDKKFKDGHFLVVVGMDHSFVYTHDPLYKKKGGQARPYPIDTFLAAWGGFTPQENPNFLAVIPKESVATAHRKPDAPVLFRVRVTFPPGINIRSGPGMNFDDIGDLNNGDELDIFKEENNWGEIGMDRWILLDNTQRI